MKFNKYLYIYTFLLLSLMIYSELSKAEIHQHQRIGYHGMVLFTDGNELFASHLPLYQRPHDYQLIYQVESLQKKQLITLLKQQMVTLLPKPFDLNLLINEQPFKINTSIYQGHFERGGKLKFIDESFEFKQLLFKRQLDHHQLSKKEKEAYFYLIDASLDEFKIVIHAIGSRPSFDMISLLNMNSCEVTNDDGFKIMKFSNQTNHSLESWNHILSQCGKQETLYFENKDFE